MGELDRKTALITGGSGRFGRVVASLLASEGANVALADLGPAEQASDLVAEITRSGQRAIALQVDVTRGDDCRRMIEETLDAFGTLDICVANAGVGGEVGMTWELSDEDWNTSVAVNLTGAWLTVKHAVPHMIARRYGKIIFISSRSGLRGEPFTAAYNAAKHGLHGLMKTLAIELGPYEINVNAICPTSMGSMAGTREHHPYFELTTGKKNATEADFDAWAGRQNLFERDTRVTPEEVAEGVLWLASDRSHLVTGHALPMDAGWIAKRGG
jgi:NAD(P)-dependent dehydrogenase (short-subunit alcohol dehydrogenase family)